MFPVLIKMLENIYFLILSNTYRYCHYLIVISFDDFRFDSFQVLTIWSTECRKCVCVLRRGWGQRVGGAKSSCKLSSLPGVFNNCSLQVIMVVLLYYNLYYPLGKFSRRQTDYVFFLFYLDRRL